jgi:hypothetical protein
MEKWTEVPFSSFFIPQVPPIIKMKTHETKNKNFKLHGAILYLILKIIKTLILFSNFFNGVDFRQYLDGSQTEVPYSFSPISDVLSTV